MKVFDSYGFYLLVCIRVMDCIYLLVFGVMVWYVYIYLKLFDIDSYGF